MFLCLLAALSACGGSSDKPATANSPESETTEEGVERNEPDTENFIEDVTCPDATEVSDLVGEKMERVDPADTVDDVVCGWATADDADQFLVFGIRQLDGAGTAYSDPTYAEPATWEDEGWDVDEHAALPDGGFTAYAAGTTCHAVAAGLNGNVVMDVASADPYCDLVAEVVGATVAASGASR